MILFYLGQVPAQWFNESGSAALAGGVLRFYEVGTSTPKAVYADYQGLASAGTSVTLNASARAKVFLNGLYSVKLETAQGVQIGPIVDGIGNAALVGDGFCPVLLNYSQLRGYDGDAFRAAIVQGHTLNGDGGAGLFVWDSVATAADDGGTILAPSTAPLSGRWQRVYDETLDPRWFGCKMDGVTADDVAFGHIALASASLGKPVYIAGGYIRLTSNRTIPSNSSVRCGINGGFTSTSSSVTISFPEDSSFEGSYGCFDGTLSPLFYGYAPIHLSWMGGVTDDDKLAKMPTANAGPHRVELRIDANLTISGGISLSTTNTKLIPSGGVITTEGSAAIAAFVECDTPTQWAAFAGSPNASAMNLQGSIPRPEWFGALGDGSTDDYKPLLACFGSGRCKLSSKRYYSASDITISSDLFVIGECDPMRSEDINSSSSSMPVSSIIMGDGKKISASGKNISFERAGFFAKSSGGGIDCGSSGRFSASNSVLGMFSLAGVAAAYASSSDCYANSGLIFAGATAYAHSNLRSNSETDRRYFTNSSHKTLWLENEVGEASAYTNLLHTKNADGEVDGTHSPVLQNVTADSISAAAISTGAPKSVGDVDYTVLDSDPMVIVVSPTVDRTITLPAAAGSSKKIRYIVCEYTVYDAQLLVTGDLLNTVGSSNPIIPAIALNRYLLTCIYIPSAGKWAVG